MTTMRKQMANSSLILQERCDDSLAAVLNEAGAQDYAATFARNDITWEILCDMRDDDLKKVYTCIRL